MHHVLNQTFDTANLSHHERRIFGLHTKDHAHFELHRETVFRDHLEGIERVGYLTCGPFHRLVCSRDNDRADSQRIDVVTSWSNYSLLNTAITFRHDISFVGAFVETPIGRIAGHQVSLNLLDSALVVHDVETSC